jgi:hypothetical protein
MRFRVCSSLVQLVFVGLLIETERGPYVQCGGPSVGKVRDCDVVSRRLQGCSPHLCQLMNDGLAPTSKY